jgi:transposase
LQIKKVPGRKTDMKDAAWIAQLLQCVLLRPSFVPDRQQRKLRDLTRQQTKLAQQRNAVDNRIQKVLETANIKLGSVASDVSANLQPSRARLVVWNRETKIAFANS